MDVEAIVREAADQIQIAVLFGGPNCGGLAAIISSAIRTATASAEKENAELREARDTAVGIALDYDTDLIAARAEAEKLRAIIKRLRDADHAMAGAIGEAHGYTAHPLVIAATKELGAAKQAADELLAGPRVYEPIAAALAPSGGDVNAMREGKQ